ncbi:MAG: hypothetical protein Q9223_004924 [Gallowayella weberi]
MKAIQILTTPYLLNSLFVTAALPPLRQPSSQQPHTLHPNLSTPEPRIYCEDGPGALSEPEIRECRSAVAHLPYPDPAVRTFGPYEYDGKYRTPIISTHATNCQATVSLVGSTVTKRESSWQLIKYAAWDVIYECLNEEKNLGYARLGEEYGIRVGISYHKRRP